MMTSARPMAMSRSRVHTRISWRRECSGAVRSDSTFTVAWPAVITGEDTGAGFSGGGVFLKCFSFELSILGYLVFIACSSQRAPDAFVTCPRSVHGAEFSYIQ